MPNPVGRPPVGPTVEIRFTPATIARLDAVAAVLGVSRAEVIRRAVAAFLEDKP